MSREQRIASARRVFEEKRQEASLSLAQRRQSLDEVDRQLGELVSYRAEYASQATAHGSGHAVHLQDYWRFMSRLNHAISEHRERLDQQAVAVQQSFERWQDVERQVAALDKVRERLRLAESRAAERAEQRVLDDLAQSSAGIRPHEVQTR